MQVGPHALASLCLMGFIFIQKVYQFYILTRALWLKQPPPQERDFLVRIFWGDVVEDVRTVFERLGGEKIFIPIFARI